ncbi:class I SAM-dependent methyltransferase [Streptomyces sp. DH37]|uniref:class I SAM-dependent methyltransferase n=1 Tax=Streptomyces sp. DH37 TaxID=3040122 RepID=UPI0024420F2D|nr:class I SAM-dependent methyltransferase [Streptomyces sp. DH37]MDG9706025.1 class I SAM-dependent methyltransferase [Streptomyces sp. DH37]
MTETSRESSHLNAVRAAYDAIAADYAEHFEGEFQAKPLALAMLDAFARTVLAHGGGPVADVGCGPGRVTAHLDSLGLDVFGVDLSPEMVALARRAYPDLRFEEGSMTGLELDDASLAGLAAWYSVIHVLPDRVPAVLSEFHRVLAPGGHLLLGFQVGDEPLHLSEAFGRAVSLDFHRMRPDRVAGLLEQAGFSVCARLLREAYDGETAPQAYLLARKPGTP